MDPIAFRSMLKEQGEERTQKMLDEGAWDEQHNRVARNWLQERRQDAAAKVKTKRRDRVSMYLLIATLAIAVIAGIAFYWPRLFPTPSKPSGKPVASKGFRRRELDERAAKKTTRLCLVTVFGMIAMVAVLLVRWCERNLRRHRWTAKSSATY